jgi:hypothetical protein
LATLAFLPGMPRTLSLLGAGLGLIACLAAANKKTPTSSRGENEDVVLNVTLYDDPTLVKDLLGNDLGGHYIVAEVKFDPKFGKELLIDRDDFELRTEKDGDHTQPLAPSQIVAPDALIVGHGKGPNAASPGMVIAGPLLIKGGGGDADKGVEVKESKEQTPAASKQEDPLKKLLEDRILPEKKTDQEVTGLLYFPMEKQKRKDLEFSYGPRATRIRLRFK